MGLALIMAPEAWGIPIYTTMARTANNLVTVSRGQALLLICLCRRSFRCTPGEFSFARPYIDFDHGLGSGGGFRHRSRHLA